MREGRAICTWSPSSPPTYRASVRAPSRHRCPIRGGDLFHMAARAGENITGNAPAAGAKAAGVLDP